MWRKNGNKADMIGNNDEMIEFRNTLFYFIDFRPIGLIIILQAQPRHDSQSTLYSLHLNSEIHELFIFFYIVSSEFD